jgi:hypothetical protein
MVNELEQKLSALDARRGKRKAVAVSEYCRKNEAFDTLLEIYPECNERRRGSIAWAISHAVDKRRWKPREDHLQLIVLYLSDENDTMAKRCFLSVFIKYRLPKEHLGTLADTCIKIIREPKESTAVRSFGITVLFKITPSYPELFHEVEDVIIALSTHEKHSVSSRAKKALASIQKRHL